MLILERSPSPTFPYRRWDERAHADIGFHYQTHVHTAFVYHDDGKEEGGGRSTSSNHRPASSWSPAFG